MSNAVEWLRAGSLDVSEADLVDADTRDKPQSNLVSEYLLVQVQASQLAADSEAALSAEEVAAFVEASEETEVALIEADLVAEAESATKAQGPLEEEEVSPMVRLHRMLQVGRVEFQEVVDTVVGMEAVNRTELGPVTMVIVDAVVLAEEAIETTAAAQVEVAGSTVAENPGA